MVCSTLGGLVLYASFGFGMWDTFSEPPGWLAAMDRLLLLLEAPVALVLRLLYHPTARFDTSRLFAIDIVGGSRFIVVVGLCVLWSIGFGYIVSYAIQRFKICCFGKPGDAAA